VADGVAEDEAEGGAQQRAEGEDGIDLPDVRAGNAEAEAPIGAVDPVGPAGGLDQVGMRAAIGRHLVVVVDHEPDLRGPVGNAVGSGHEVLSRCQVREDAAAFRGVAHIGGHPLVGREPSDALPAEEDLAP
jgi:hypothetical protein